MTTENKKLKDLLGAVICSNVSGPCDIAVTGLCADSRAVKPGNIFVAVRGPLSDGHAYIGAAVDAGATCVVCEQMPGTAPDGVTWVVVPDSAEALGWLASEWYGNPSRKLTLVGVTGTNGKTTIATLLYEAARLDGQRAGLLSTVENRVDAEVFPAHNTTPSPLEINRLLARMVECGCTFAAMEVSSHGQAQKRTAGLHFSGGIFTNLTRDHLDYHKTFEAYLAAKKSFFDMLPATAWALTNADDSHGAVMLQNCRARRYSYSMRGAADFRGKVVELHAGSTVMNIDGVELQTQFTGRFNAANLLAVYGALRLTGHNRDDAALTLSKLVPVAGRFQTFRSADGVTVVVDYAHTPDALENVLGTLQALRQPGQKITTVVGAGGNRDHGKRPMMGAVSARLSDRVIITNDNPRDEDPADIASDVAAGIPLESPAQVDIILDRGSAIQAAVSEAAPGDFVLVAGKGHEDYQIIGARTIHFDDRETARLAIDLRNKE